VSRDQASQKVKKAITPAFAQGGILARAEWERALLSRVFRKSFASRKSESLHRSIRRMDGKKGSSSRPSKRAFLEGGKKKAGFLNKGENSARKKGSIKLCAVSVPPSEAVRCPVVSETAQKGKMHAAMIKRKEKRPGTENGPSFLCGQAMRTGTSDLISMHLRKRRGNSKLGGAPRRFRSLRREGSGPRPGNAKREQGAVKKKG